MLKITKKPMFKLLIGAMFIGLVPTGIVFAADKVVNNIKTIQTAGSAVSANGVNTTTGAAIKVNAANVTTGPGANVNYGDITAPVFNSISIDKKSATNGDILTVTVEASDDMSGIESISLSYDAPSGSASKYVSLIKNSQGKYSGTITIGSNDAIGVWKVGLISIRDNASNKISIFNNEKFESSSLDDSITTDLSAGDFEVNGTTPDVISPIFKSISIDKKNATTGDILTVTVEASDDMSGIESISLSYDAPSGSASKYVSLIKNSQGKYSGTITIGSNDAIGVWKVGLISIRDNASNKISIFNNEKFESSSLDDSITTDLSAGDFEINGTIPDTTAPVFNSISIDKKNVSKGEKITVTVDSSDDISGIDSISLSYDAPLGNASKYVSLIKNSQGKYSGTITVGLNDAIGVWKVELISIRDNASNKIAIFNNEKFESSSLDDSITTDLSAGDFEVNSTVLDPIVIPIPKPIPDVPTKEIEMPTSIRITGTEKVESVLTAEILKNDSDFIPETSKNVVYEWYRLDNEYSRTGSLVGRNKTYYLTSNDLNKYIKLVVYYNNKKINEDITSKIINIDSSSSSNPSSGNSSSSSSGSSSTSSSGSSSSSSSGSSSTSSSGNSSSSSSSSSSHSSSDDPTTTINNENIPSDNTKVTNTAKVEKSQDGTIKLVNDVGQAVTGWQQIAGKWYLADRLGVAQTSWQQTNGTWYFLNNDGVMATGWKQVNGNWYLLKDNGAMTTGWQQVNGKWYLLNDNGSMATGWQQTNGKWYYLYSDGSMASNTAIDGYRVDENGAWV